MTLILAIPAVDGFVMASDGQITTGMVRSEGQKIFRLNSNCLWAASGELALIQRVEERLNSLPDEQSLVILRDSISRIIHECVTELLQLDFRTRFLPQDNPNRLLELHQADFVFVDANDGILHILHSGTPEWIHNRPFATGNGFPFAYALLRKYAGMKMSLEKASILAYKVLEEAIEVGAYGLGPPIDMWHIKKDEIRQLK